jgi:NADH-quinone oxidoreductase subunit C
MKQEEIRDLLVGKFGADTVQSTEFAGQITAVVPAERIVEILTYLKETPGLEFNFLSFVAGVDKLPEKPRFEMVYQLNSLTQNHRFRIKALVDEPAEGLPAVDSVVSVWPTADWHERETAEMFGITFNNHPDPRKLLLPEEWTVFPLRKDFPLVGTEEDTPDLPKRPQA